MVLVQHLSPRSFCGVALPLLLDEEIRYNRIIGSALAGAGTSADERASNAWFGTIQQNGHPVACAMLLPGLQLDLTAMPQEAALPLVQGVLEATSGAGARLLRISGPAESVAFFAKHWTQQTGATGIPAADQLIYGCHQLRPSGRRTPGIMRPALPSDRPLLTRWMEHFTADTGLLLPEASSLVGGLEGRGMLFVWDTEGEPRCMAGIPRRTPNGSGLAYVYSPPEHRGRGFATAIAEALTRRELASRSKFCFLYTDRSHPAPNAIYRRLGYEPVAEVVDVSMTYR